jgi:transglutaminase-like putative cysteine protease
MNRAAAPLQWLAMGLLGVGLLGVPWSQLLGGLAMGLGALTALKLWEARSIRERRLVGLLQLVCAGLLASIQPDLAGSLLQGLASLLALSGLLALELEEGLGWRVMLRRSGQLVLATLPMVLVLFLLVPRLGPFTVIESGRGAGATTGLSDTLDPAGIAELSSSQAPAARVAFPLGVPPPAGQRYWRVLVHDHFDGRRWSSGEPARPLRPAAAARGEPVAESVRGQPQVWLNEASGLRTVPWSGAGRPLGPDLRIDRLGQLRHDGPMSQRRVYTVVDDGGPPAWRRRPPGPLEQQLPAGTNPRLEALGRSWGALETPSERLEAAERWFRSQPFRYTLKPGTLPARAPMDSFLFERREGFCGHYASALTALMRAAGVPARVVSGYRGGDWVVPLGGIGYLDIRQGHAHAWSEVWIPQEGWRSVDPTTWALAPPGDGALTGRGPLLWLQHQWWGLDLAWTRFWLGFDQQGQEALVRRLLGERRAWLGALVLVGLGAGLGVGVALLGWLQRRTGGGDAWRRELDRSLTLFASRGLVPEAGETLPHFAARVERRWPELGEDLTAFVSLYQRRRFAPPQGSGGTGELRRFRRRLGRRLASQLGRPRRRPVG